MYEKFFGLKEKPFNVTSDPSFLFFSRKHKEAFAHLVYGIKERKGFLEITGEIGTGKTTICKALLSSLDNNTKTALVLNPDLSKYQLMRSIVRDLGIELKKSSDQSLLDALNAFLIQQLSLGNNVVVIIDEAQNLKSSLLETIRLLSNLETEKEKLLQIVLVGQPELRQRLALPELRQIRQRISVRYHIGPLDEDEVEDYIEHRLNVAGSEGQNFFTKEAMGEIYRYSLGVPRLINVLSDKALLSGFAEETRTITPEMIRRCINEIEGIEMAAKEEVSL